MPLSSATPCFVSQPTSSTMPTTGQPSFLCRSTASAEWSPWPCVSAIASGPFAAVAGLVCFGAYLEKRADAVLGTQALLWGLATALLVVSCAARSNMGATTLPPLGWSALLGCLGVFAIKACLGVGPWL